MADFINIIKKIWNNPRYKALIILALYILFFSIIFIMAKVANTSNTSTPKETAKTSISAFKDEYDYNFNIEVDQKIISGHYSMDVITFNYDGISYIYENNILTPSDFEYVEIIDYINTSYVYDLIKDEEVYSKTEFKDNTICNTYKLDNIEISLYESDKIYQVDIKIDDKIYKITYN